MRRVFNGQSNESRAASRRIYFDVNECIGQRESPTPYNTLAHRHLERWGGNLKRCREAMQRHAAQGKIKHTANTVLAHDRYEFSDGSMLVFTFGSVYVVDVNCSASLRAYLQRLGPVYAPAEALLIEQFRAMRQGWGAGLKLPAAPVNCAENAPI